MVEYFDFYRETRVKNVLNISEDGSLLTYNQTRVFHFSPETSGEGLSEEDTICTINLPIVVCSTVEPVLVATCIRQPPPYCGHFLMILDDPFTFTTTCIVRPPV